MLAVLRLFEAPDNCAGQRTAGAAGWLRVCIACVSRSPAVLRPLEP
jgi:hypothetical protein